MQMRLVDTLLTVFSATIEDRDGAPVVRIPEQELDLGTLSEGDTYRIAILESGMSSGRPAENAPPENRHQHPSSGTEPPVAKGERLNVEIEDVGEQGDGIARVGPGYVVFVPDAELGDRVTIEITRIRENFGFAEVVTPEPVSD